MFCRECGKEITQEANVCNFCGASQQEESSVKPVTKSTGKGMKIGAIVLLSFAAVLAIAGILDVILGMGNHTDGVNVVSLIKQMGFCVILGGIGGFMLYSYNKKQNS